MADDPFNSDNIRFNPLDIYNDAGLTTQPSVRPLPIGGCNFVDLNPGANGHKCGCRRFWPRPSLGSSISDQAGWCMCAHHACYHDHASQDTRQSPFEQRVSAAPAGQENEPSHTGRQPLSPVTDILMQNVETSAPVLDFADFSPGMPLSFVHDLPIPIDETRTDRGQSHLDSMPDTLAWDDYVQFSSAQLGRQPELSYIKVIPQQPPPQPLLLSQTTSTTSSAQVRYLRPFGGKGLDTLSKKVATETEATSHPQEPPTVCSTPSNHPSNARCQPDGSFETINLDDKQVEIPTPRPGTTTQKVPRVDQAYRDETPREVLRNLSDTLYVHEERLDRLETVSFSANGHDECVDKHDHMDLRVTELELRMDGVEKASEAAQRVHTFDTKDDDGATSVTSISSSTTGRATNDDIISQLSSLQARVTHMQSFLPSLAHAWTVEIVFLPFPLNKLWQNMSQFKSEPTIDSDDWTQTPMTASSAVLRSQSPISVGWPTAGRDDVEWLYPRACGDKSTQDMRLRSCGLIQTVSFCSPHAKGVQAAIHKAFEARFRAMGITSRHGATNPLVSKYLGLQEAWVPLRKIHKDSRLRFLSAAELLTPASWNVNFLHSITMKAVQPRLFITHPDAYIQDYTSYENGWTWPRIRNLDKVCLDVTESQNAREANVVDNCWLWNDQLDGAPNTLAALNVRRSRERKSASPHRRGTSTSQRTLRSVSPFIVRDPQQHQDNVPGHRALRPHHIRTASVPNVSAFQPYPASAGRRRISSHGQRRQSSPLTRGLSQSGVQKRPRTTRSPSYPRHTPRWTVSPSPMSAGLSERYTTRGITPLAYATPYSNVPLQELRPMRGSSIARSTTDQLDTGCAADELFDIEICETRSDESYTDDEFGNDDDDDEDENSNNERGLTHIYVNMQHESQHRQLPEDEPWPGIEDIAHASNEEKPESPRGTSDDQQSNTSSQPSEYPTTQAAWQMDHGGDAGFRIHEDQE